VHGTGRGAFVTDLSDKDGGKMRHPEVKRTWIWTDDDGNVTSLMGPADEVERVMEWYGREYGIGFRRSSVEQ